MRLTGCRFLAVVSLLSVVDAANVAGRPRYGGTLRVETQGVVRSLDPWEWPADASWTDAKERLVSLVFDTLVRLDESGRPRPGLAVSWQRDAEGRKWQFHLRTDVIFHDGSPMTPESVVASLQPIAELVHARVTGGGLAIECDQPAPDLLYVLAQPRNAIVLRGADSKISGTGPFRPVRWESGKRAAFEACVKHWAGRPFLDGIEIEMARPPREQVLDLELGKADLVEIWPNEVRRVAQRGIRIWASSPMDLIALAFESRRPSVEDPRLREAVALSIDRSAIFNVLLQKQGELAAGLLPQKLSGYAFLFSSAPDPRRARQLITRTVQASPPLLLAYDGADPLGRVMAERIAVNIRDAGVAVQVSGLPANADLRVVRFPLRSPLPATALSQLISFFHPTDARPPADPTSIEAIYSAERAILDSYRVIPLFHVAETFASNPRLKSWATPGITGSGNWRLDDLWLEAEK